MQITLINNISLYPILVLGMCTIHFSQTLLANQNTGTNQEMSSFALSEPMNGMAVVGCDYLFSYSYIRCTLN